MDEANLDNKPAIIDTSSSEPKRMSLEEAVAALQRIQSIDPNTIHSEEDLRQFNDYTDAINAVVTHILTTTDYITTSPNHYMISWKPDERTEHLLSVTYPIENAQSNLGWLATHSERLKFIKHTTPADISLSTDIGGKDSFLFVFRSQPIYEGQFESYKIHATTYDINGEFEKRVDISPGASWLKPTDYQFGAQTMQRSSEILLDHIKSTPLQIPNK